MEVQTERLLIRTLAAEDAPALAAIWCGADAILRNDADVTRFMGGPRDCEQTYRDLLSEAARRRSGPRENECRSISRSWADPS